MSRDHRLERVQLLPPDLPTVFAFFTDVANLATLTPDFLRFRILTPPPIRVTAGALFDYEIRLWGVPVRWRTRIESVVPGRRFVDVQVSGPYRRWRHVHDFFAVPGGTLVVDTVDYALPFGPLGRLVHPLLVRRSLERIFDFRRERLVSLFGAEPPV